MKRCAYYFIGLLYFLSHISCLQAFCNVTCDANAFCNITGAIPCDPQGVDCNSTAGTYFCTCNVGYYGNGSVCSDLNECNSSVTVCNNNATCHNTNGSFQCSCNAGFMSNGTACYDIDECLNTSAVCSPLATCNNTIGSYYCTCNAGFNGSGSFCYDLNECNYSSPVCANNATCNNTYGSFQCSCNAGFMSNGSICNDIDECLNASAVCSPLAICNNTIGSYYCTCNAGFYSSGSLCFDLNECNYSSPVCANNATCNNTYGSFHCSCNAGFEGNSTLCSDIDECLNSSSLCPSVAECNNTIGSYFCTCNAGFYGHGSLCFDLNECNYTSPVCPLNATCNNTYGSFQCSCNAGFAGNSTLCSDVDECNEINDCAVTATCNNTIGSYFCTCDIGYNGSGIFCSDINECLFVPTVCQHAVCNNTEGSFSCACNTGFLKSQSDERCYDIDECATCSANDCDINADCNNTIGSFLCVCSSGFYGNGSRGDCLDICDAHHLDECDWNSNCSFSLETDREYFCTCKLGYILESKALNVTKPCIQQQTYTVDPNCQYSYTLPPAESPGFTQQYFPDAIGFRSQYTLSQPEDGTCVDFDECLSSDRNTCNAHATCTNTDGSFTCSCKSGWNGTGVGASCFDINECKTKNSCSPNATCFNTNGSYYCVCLCGFTGNGTFCADINECATANIATSVYTATNASFNVTTSLLNRSFSTSTSVPPVCVVNRISAKLGLSVFTNNCNRYAICTNTIGSFKCQCPIGFLDVRNSGTPGLNCSNIDECAPRQKNDCSPQALCTDTIGSYVCTCNTGFVGNGTIGNCTDINECLSRPCRLNATCFNTFGSYSCNCSAGYFGKNPDQCMACSPGTYKSSPGSANCTLCKAGKYGPSSAATNLSFCVACQEHSNSSQGSFSPQQCLCNAGFTNSTPTNLSMSPTNLSSTNLSSANSFVTCVACQAGKYKSMLGPANCTVCGSGKFSNTLEAATNESACISCPSNSYSSSGSYNRTSCLCVPGYTSLTPLWGNVSCTLCKAGTFKSSYGSGLCTNCDPGKYSSSTGLSKDSECRNCTSYSFSPQGSSNVNNCSCNIGFTGTSILCTICPTSTYKNISGSSVCVGCPSNADSPSGSTNLSDCSCNKGYSGENGGYCTSCAQNFYSVGLGNCIPCPSNMTSDVASQAIDDCACNAGFFGTDGTSCLPCPPGTYKSMIGSLECQPCPSNSYSNRYGSNNLELCTCNIGFASYGSNFCLDINECRTESVPCSGLAQCVNTVGSFYCKCPRFYYLDGNTCNPMRDVVEIVSFVQINSSVFAATLDLYLQAFAMVANVTTLNVDIWIQPPLSRNLSALNVARRIGIDTCGLQCIGQIVTYFTVDIHVTNNTKWAILSNQSGFLVRLESAISGLGLTQVGVFSISEQVEICGDGILELQETCDVGSSLDHHGCSSSCQIEPGWVCPTPGLPCSDINECTAGLSTCSAYASCTNTNGSFECTCIYTLLDVLGDGTVCDDFAPGLELNRSQSLLTSFSSESVILNGFNTLSSVLDVALFGDTLLVGRSHSSDVWLYERPVNQPWPSIPSFALHGPDSCNFGISVALTQNFAFVGTNAGCIYIYKRNSTTQSWNSSSFQNICRNETFFGTVLAVNEDELVIGAYAANMAFLFKNIGGDSWSVEPSVIFYGGSNRTFFGHSIALTGMHLAIASLGSGIVCLFVKKNTTWPLNPDYTVTVPIIERPGSFTHRSISLTDNYLLVGIPNDRSAFIFSRKADSEDWPDVPTQTFQQPTGMFGFCVSMTDMYAVISAYRNNVAYVFRSFSNGTWLENPVQILSEQGIPARFLGFSCAMTNFEVVLGSFQVHDACPRETIFFLKADYFFLYKIGWSGLRSCSKLFDRILRLVHEIVHKVPSSIIVPPVEPSCYRLLLQSWLVWSRRGPMYFVSCKFLVSRRERVEQLFVFDTEHDRQQFPCGLQSQHVHRAQGMAEHESSRGAE